MDFLSCPKCGCHWLPEQIPGFDLFECPRCEEQFLSAGGEMRRIPTTPECKALASRKCSTPRVYLSHAYRTDDRILKAMKSFLAGKRLPWVWCGLHHHGRP